MFPTTLVTDMFNLVKGHSSIAKMIPSAPIAFNGNTEFTFSMDKGVAVVGESAEKPAGDAKVTPVTIRPIKVVYQSRVSNEFIYASEEAKLNYLKAFADGFSKTLAKGLDLMIMHGTNPATGTASSAVIGNNHLDYVIANYDSGANVIPATANPDADINSALDKVEDATGIIIGKTMRGSIAGLTVNGANKYPEFAWGATPATLGGMKLDSNSTVEANSATARAYVGDWNALKWGFAKQIPLEVIEYGNPDGQGDLKLTNEVVLRSEAFVGWGILDASSFASINAGA